MTKSIADTIHYAIENNLWDGYDEWRDSQMSLRLDLLAKDIFAVRAYRSLRDIGDEIGISKATFHRVENGGVPNLITFAKLCKLTGRDPRVYLNLKNHK